MEAHKSSTHKIDLTQVFRASQLFSQTDVIEETPLLKHDLLSTIYGAEILLKREDRQLGTCTSTQGTRTRSEVHTTNT
jgi:threonine dehydratase